MLGKEQDFRGQLLPPWLLNISSYFKALLLSYLSAVHFSFLISNINVKSHRRTPKPSGAQLCNLTWRRWLRPFFSLSGTKLHGSREAAKGGR